MWLIPTTRTSTVYVLPVSLGAKERNCRERLATTCATTAVVLTLQYPVRYLWHLCHLVFSLNLLLLSFFHGKESDTVTLAKLTSIMNPGHFFCVFLSLRWNTFVTKFVLTLWKWRFVWDEKKRNLSFIHSFLFLYFTSSFSSLSCESAFVFSLFHHKVLSTLSLLTQLILSFSLTLTLFVLFRMTKAKAFFHPGSTGHEGQKILL